MSRFSPYDDNGGTCVAVAGKDFCIVAASMRLSTGYSILTRRQSKILRANAKCCIASAGFQGDKVALQKLLTARAINYEHDHRRKMSCPAMAQMLSNTLYNKRFFPFYTFNLCAGLDTEGKGCVYTYDAIGSYERVGYSCQGSGKDLMQPVLDNQLASASPLLWPPVSTATKLTRAECLELVRSAFASAAERDIYTGDAVQIFTMTRDGLTEETMQLRRD